MKLELLDAYNIRARLSASIILLAPIAVTVFLCCEEVMDIASSSVFLGILLAFTNYIPILQRRINSRKTTHINYAAQLLYVSNTTLDPTTKKRFYKKLATLDSAFACFENPDDSDAFHACCNSAIVYLRNRTRNNHLVQEENINYGFIKNLLASKPLGIALCLLLEVAVVSFSLFTFSSLSAIPSQNYFAICFNLFMLVFWVWGVNQKTLESTAVQYATALISAIDSFDT